MLLLLYLIRLNIKELYKNTYVRFLRLSILAQTGFRLSDSTATASVLVLYDTFMYSDLRIRRHTEKGTSLSEKVEELTKIERTPSPNS